MVQGRSKSVAGAPGWMTSFSLLSRGRGAWPPLTLLPPGPSACRLAGGHLQPHLCLLPNWATPLGSNGPWRQGRKSRGGLPLDSKVNVFCLQCPKFVKPFPGAEVPLSSETFPGLRAKCWSSWLGVTWATEWQNPRTLEWGNPEGKPRVWY